MYFIKSKLIGSSTVCESSAAFLVIFQMCGGKKDAFCLEGKVQENNRGNT